MDQAVVGAAPGVDAADDDVHAEPLAEVEGGGVEVADCQKHVVEPHRGHSGASTSRGETGASLRS